ncbi:MAG: hypothetical protein K2W96_27015 [Gemmataceae bacterium]|nr:hypothetical protein [Gemmataceae bacterium]
MLSSLVRAAVGLVQRFRTVVRRCPLPDGGSATLRLRFLHLAAERERAVGDSLCRVLRAVHLARQDAADLIAGKASPAVADLFNRWFGGQRRGVPSVLLPQHLQAVLGVLMAVHRGLRAGPLIVEGIRNEDAIAWSNGSVVLVGPRYWSEAPPQARADGILFHELTHLFAGTTDAAAGLDGPVYIHEPGGPDLAYPSDPIEYRDSESGRAGLYPPPEDLVRLADAYECFLEDGYLRR